MQQGQLELKYSDELANARYENNKLKSRLADLEKKFAVHVEKCRMEHEQHKKGFEAIMNSEREIKRDLKENYSDISTKLDSFRVEIRKMFLAAAVGLIGILAGSVAWLLSQYLSKITEFSNHMSSLSILI